MKIALAALPMVALNGKQWPALYCRNTDTPLLLYRYTSVSVDGRLSVRLIIQFCACEFEEQIVSSKVL